MLYQTILAATEGLEHSDRALEHAAALAHDTGARRMRDAHVVALGATSSAGDRRR